MADADDIPEPDRVDGAPHPRLTPHVFGHDSAARSFIDAMHSGRLHHAWMVTGPKGIGKATLAWQLARALLRFEQGDGWQPQTPADLYVDPDDALFRRVGALAEPRVAVLRRAWDADAKRLKTEITVDAVRALKSFFNLSATDGGWRVAVVDAADEMNTAAANALLKVLEEPPARTAFFLIAHQPGRLLPTIKSRCRTLSCNRLSPTDLGLALDAAGHSLDLGTTGLAELADGSAGVALALIQAEGEELYADIAATFATLPRLDRGKVLALADACAGREKASRYALTRDMIALFVNRTAKSGASGTALPDACTGEAETIARLAPTPDHGRAWAELAQVLSSRMGHAASVNLDPASVILDTFLQINAAAARMHR